MNQKPKKTITEQYYGATGKDNKPFFWVKIEPILKDRERERQNLWSFEAHERKGRIQNPNPRMVVVVVEVERAVEIGDGELQRIFLVLMGMRRGGAMVVRSEPGEEVG